MRWRRSMLVVSSSSRRAFLAAGLAAASPDASHPTECVPRAASATDARTATALGAILRPVEELGVRNTDGGEEEVQGGGGSAAMVATTASISWPAAADFLPLLVLSSSWDWEVGAEWRGFTSSRKADWG